MSFNITKTGTADECKEAVADAVNKSVSYDAALAQKGDGVIEACDKLIDTVGDGMPEGKALYVNCAGHISGETGDTTYSFTSRYVDAPDQGEGAE